MGTVTTSQRRYYDEDDEADLLSPNFSRTLVVGVVYGLVAWFHFVLCAAYAVAGLVPVEQLSSVYGANATVWGIAYCASSGAMLVVAIGLVGAHPWAWRAAPWAVVPNLLVHGVFIVVLPVWGAVGIASDLLAIAIIVLQRPRVQVAIPAGRQRLRRLWVRGEGPSLLGNGPST